MLKYLVVGTGRCGTGYFQEMFELSGIRCGHESIFFSNSEEQNRLKYTQNDIFEAESSWAAAPFIDKTWFDENIKIIHLVRHPLKVIKSFYDINFFSEQRASKLLNKLVYENTAINIDNLDRLRSSVDHYFEWNRLIECKLSQIRNPRILIRLEELNNNIQKVEDFLQIKLVVGSEIVNEKRSEKSSNLNSVARFDEEMVLDIINTKYGDRSIYGYL